MCVPSQVLCIDAVWTFHAVGRRILTDPCSGPFLLWSGLLWIIFIANTVQYGNKTQFLLKNTMMNWWTEECPEDTRSVTTGYVLHFHSLSWTCSTDFTKRKFSGKAPVKSLTKRWPQLYSLLFNRACLTTGIGFGKRRGPACFKWKIAFTVGFSWL